MAENIGAYLSEAKRMGGLEFTPSTPEAWAELAKVLKRQSKSLEHAGRIVSRFLQPGAPTRCPTPGELAMMARSVPAEAKLDSPDLPAACIECAPYGGVHRIVERNGFEGADRCGCARGVRLRELDALRSHPEPRKPARSLERPPADWQRRAAGDES